MSVDVSLAVAESKSRPINERSDLTRLQFLYWVAQVMRPDAPFLNTVVVFTVAGAVDVDAFRLAFQELIDQSDALRTTIVEMDGVLKRIVAETLPYALPLIDFSQEDNPQVSYDEWVQEKSLALFDFEACLFDSALLKLGADKFVWYFNQHHVMADASSFFLAYRYVAEAYEAALAGRMDELGKRPLFQTYIDHERNFRESPRFEKSAQYWQRKLLPGPELSRYSGKLSSSKRSTKVTRVSVDLGQQLSQQLREAAQQKGLFTINLDLSLYNIFAALFFIQLQRLTKNQRLGVVTPVHNRSTEAFRETIGLFMELCPLQIEMDSADTFASVVKKVRKETRSTMPHYQYGSSISLPNDTFDAMFNMHNVPTLKLDGMRTDFVKLQPGHGSESVACHVYDYEAEGNFIVHLDFHDDLFSKKLRDETAVSFLHTVNQFLIDIEQPLVPVFGETAVSPSATNGTAPPINQRPNYVAPQNDMENQMVRIWEELLNVSPIGVHDNFHDLGGSSWLATKLFVRIQEVTGHNLPLSTLLEASTVAGMVTVMRAMSDGKKLWSPIVTLKQGDEGKRPFFLVPGAGGNLLRLDKLVGYLNLDRPIKAFQVPGLDGEQQQYTSIDAMATHMVGVMQSVQSEGPYLLGGYSWGGMIAFAMAQQLTQLGETVEILSIIDTPAQHPRYGIIKNGIQKLSKIAGWGKQKQERNFLVVRDYLFRFEYFMRNFGSYSLREKVFILLRKVKTAGMKMVTAVSSSKANKTEPQPVQQNQNGDFWSRFNLDPVRLRIVRTNDRAIRLYILAPYSGATYLFQSSKGYRNPLNRSAWPQMGWENVIQGGVTSQKIPGDHLGMLDEPNVRVLAQGLQVVLEKVN